MDNYLNQNIKHPLVSISKAALYTLTLTYFRDLYIKFCKPNGVRLTELQMLLMIHNFGRAVSFKDLRHYLHSKQELQLYLRWLRNKGYLQGMNDVGKYKSYYITGKGEMLIASFEAFVNLYIV